MPGLNKIKGGLPKALAVGMDFVAFGWGGIIQGQTERVIATQPRQV